MLELEGRTAVVTGAGSGIGRALALQSGERRMTVAIADVDAKGLEQTEAMLRERQVPVLAQRVDVTDMDSVSAFAAACNGLPELATVWANAGIIQYNKCADIDLAGWNRVIDVNLRGPINTMAAFLPRMRAAKNPSRMIFTSSQAAFMTAPEIGSYVASKHGVWGFAETLKQELAIEQSPVGVTMLCPPRTASALISETMSRVKAQSGEEGLQEFLKALPQPEDIARAGIEGALNDEFIVAPGIEEIAEFVSNRFKTILEML